MKAKYKLFLELPNCRHLIENAPMGVTHDMGVFWSFEDVKVECEKNLEDDDYITWTLHDGNYGKEWHGIISSDPEAENEWYRAYVFGGEPLKPNFEINTDYTKTIADRKAELEESGEQLGGIFATISLENIFMDGENYRHRFKSYIFRQPLKWF